MSAPTVLNGVELTPMQSAALNAAMISFVTCVDGANEADDPDVARVIDAARKVIHILMPPPARPDPPI